MMKSMKLSGVDAVIVFLCVLAIDCLQGQHQYRNTEPGQC